MIRMLKTTTKTTTAKMTTSKICLGLNKRCLSIQVLGLQAMWWGAAFPAPPPPLGPPPPLQKCVKVKKGNPSGGED